jgi:HK97 family phage major capsid protein
MLTKVKLLAKITLGEGESAVTHEKDAILNVDAETAKEWIANGTAEDHTKAAEKVIFDKAVSDAVDARLAAIKATQKADAPRIDGVHDTTEDDPTYGYLPGKKSYTEDEAVHVSGQVMLDVWKMAGGTGAPPRVLKAREIADKHVASLKEAGHLVSVPEEDQGGAAVPPLMKSLLLGRKAAGTGSIIGADAYGGFTVETLRNNMLLNRDTLEAVVVRPRATRIPLSGSPKIELPIFNDSDHSNKTFFGGVQALWQSELQQLSETRPAFEQVKLELIPLTALGYVSQEMERWGAASIGSVLIPKFQQAVAWKEDDGFINGNGAGQPKGLLNANSKITVDKESGQVAATIVYENILNMVARVLISRPSSVAWIANRTTLPQLATMSLTIGTGGAPVFLPANLAAGQPLASLFGYPIVFTEKAQTLGTEGDIVLTDLSEYGIGDDSMGPAVDRSIHLKFDYRQVAFRIVQFVDGQPLWRTNFTPANGDTLSRIVTLQTRS